MWSSWFLGREDARRCPMDSCARYMHTFRFLESCRGYTLPFQFPEVGSMSSFLLCPFLARHGRLHRNFQISLHVFDSFFVFSIFQNNKVNASQPPSVVELWLLDCPFLLFSLPSGFSNFGPYFRPHILRSGSCLSYRQCPLSQTTCVLLEFFLSNLNFVNPV